MGVNYKEISPINTSNTAQTCKNVSLLSEILTHANFCLYYMYVSLPCPREYLNQKQRSPDK